LQYGWDRCGTICCGDRGRFGHQVEIKEFYKLEFYLSGSFSRLEEGCNGEEAVQILECACVLRGFDETTYEGYNCGRLDSWAIDWFKEVEEVLFKIHG
jgi:hypothetical protein